MSEWIEHQGSKFAPVAEWVLVDVITNKGRLLEEEPAGTLDWSRDGSDWIIGYRPSSKAQPETPA